MNPERAAALRYKRPALAAMGYDIICAELNEIFDTCEDLLWAEQEINQPVMDGDPDDGMGYRMDFAEIEADAERLIEQLNADSEMFDDCTVALIGNRYALVGYDTEETDYFSLCSWESERAETESAKRLLRLTKQEMLSTIGRSVGIMTAFYDLRQRFDYLKASLDVMLDHNLDTLRTVRSIEDAYEAWCDDLCPLFGEKYRALCRACDRLDDIYWIV